jgi:hypothetical protein
MARCSICRRAIWPWQRLGFRVEADGRREWHTRCATLEPEGMARSPTPLREHEPFTPGSARPMDGQPSTEDGAADRG